MLHKIWHKNFGEDVNVTHPNTIHPQKPCQSPRNIVFLLYRYFKAFHTGLHIVRYSNIINLVKSKIPDTLKGP